MDPNDFPKLFQRDWRMLTKPVWWCPNLCAVLANEEVVTKIWSGKPSVERDHRQVVLRITAMQKKLAGLDDLDRPDTKRQQKHGLVDRKGRSICHWRHKWKTPGRVPLVLDIGFITWRGGRSRTSHSESRESEWSQSYVEVAGEEARSYPNRFHLSKLFLRVTVSIQ